MKIYIKITQLAVLVIALGLNAISLAKPTLEDYGNLPQLTSMDISPNGKRVAYIKEVDGEPALLVVDTQSKQIVGGTRFGKMKARGLSFITDNLIRFSGSETIRFRGQSSDTELFATFVYNFATGKSKIMLGDNTRLFPGSSGSAGISRIDVKAETMYMGAREGLYGGFSNPINLYKVDLNTGKGKRYSRGTPHTLGWLMNEDNEIKARFDYHNSKEQFQVYSYLEGKPTKIYTKKANKPDVESIALMADQKRLIIVDDETVFTINLADGSQADYTNVLNDAVVAGLLTDSKGFFSGLHYTGLRPFNQYLDPDRQAAYDLMRNQFPGSQVSISGQTEDKQKLLVYVSGNDMPGGYVMYDRKENKLTQVASNYPSIAKADIGEIQSIEYKARDGMTIPAVLTWPVGLSTADQRKNLPLIVLPHGGPEAHDTVRFDWWSQFLASKGYLVLQPNFRGSTGFGWKHTVAGHGRWGAEMQYDVSDGVLAMIKAGFADKDRVCIMGASYGGYAAMAGAAFTPELYQCSVAVAGVSDIHQMLARTKNNAGSHWIVRHWQQLMGESKDDKDKLKRVSPINSVNNVSVPMLIMHGDDDTVVPIYQSKIMHKALKAAKKDSRFVTLKKEDHWLSNSATRLQMIKEIDRFLEKHNPS